MATGNKPYLNLKNNKRFFSETVSQGELVWHKDPEDRVIQSLFITNWLIQIDNELPKSINKPVVIKKNTFHRLIKGDGNLIIQLLKKQH